MMQAPAPLIPPPLPAYAQPGTPAPPPVPAAAPFPAAASFPAPAPAFAPPPVPQGYPGPAVAAPAPTAPTAPAAPAPAYTPPTAPAAPAPAFYGAPQAQAAPQPAYGVPQAYGYGQAPAAVYGPPASGGYGQAADMSGGFDIGAAIANATGGGDKDPQPGPGSYVFEIQQTIVTTHPLKGTRTFKASLKILASSNPAFPQGSEVVYIEGLQYGGTRIGDFLSVAAGYPSRLAFDQHMMQQGKDPKREMAILGNAAGNPEVQQQGNPFPANPLKGRRIAALVTHVVGTYGANSPKRGQQKEFNKFDWSLAA